MLQFLRRQIERLRYYNTVTNMARIMRRYFAMSSFDGAITLFGLLLGSFIAGVADAGLILKIGLSTAVAIGFSGLTGAMMAERAERKRELKKMERALSRKLDNTDYKKAYDFATIVIGMVNGLTPLLTAVALLLPFLAMPIPDAYYYSFAMALALFFFIGVFLGAISRENVFTNGIKLLGVGLLCMIIILFLEHFWTFV